MMKPDQHGIFNLSESESYWSCGFGKCPNKAEFKICEIYFGDTYKARMFEKGACKKCALKWAQKDNCQSCLRKINEKSHEGGSK